MAMKMSRPTMTATGMSMGLLSVIHLAISRMMEAPSQLPLLHLPPPSHEVPSRKFCILVKHVLAPNSGEAQLIWQPCELQAYVSLPAVREPMSVLHCRSREVHWSVVFVWLAPVVSLSVLSGV